jgi:hypothetical protein
VQYKGKGLGYHVTEEAAAQAYVNYVEDGVDHVQRREGSSSQFKAEAYTRPLLSST